MATSNNNTLQSDITKMKAEKDGSFKRADASFRNVIEKGGHFEPQPGAELF
jgi:putative glutathione S-transferase